MEKIILVDGNNLLFRSYYATAYNGNLMKNSKNFPTNALFGFVNMINKIVSDEKPVYMIVAFDKGKTFRHKKYDFYKGGRGETPDELKMQFPLAKEILDAMGIKYYEIDNYEADDIIGTFSEYCNKDSKYDGLIISSDKDLLQLITDDVHIKLLKQKDYIYYDKNSFISDYGIEPIHVIDLKALMGDASDNIPGVKGIGEKTALKLLQEYKTLDNIYNNIDNIKGALKVKLTNDKENAYMSYEIATIVKDVPIEISLEDIKYKGENHEKLINIYEELEFYSFIKKQQISKPKEESKVVVLDNLDDVKITEDSAVYLEILGHNYHTSKILGLAIYNKSQNFYIPFEVLKKNPSILNGFKKITYDLKKHYVALKWQNINFDNVLFDTMLASYLLDYNIKDDIAYLANSFNYDIEFYENIYGKTKFVEPSIDVIKENASKKAKFIYETVNEFKDKIKSEEMENLLYDIEMPLSYVLGDMEYDGVYVDTNKLTEMGNEIKVKIEEISNQIYEIAGEKFNISSPKQLGEVLFEKMQLPYNKKRTSGYSTSIDVLTKLKDINPIINLIIDYRMYSKLFTTYIEGLSNYVLSDNKIHTIYTQALTRTGRLSSIEPNLQNIPTRQEYGKLIKKAFVPSDNSLIVSADYSQIELRILASMAGIDSLIEAFKNGDDIHAKTASDIFHVPIDDVTSEMRRMAKAVNFGIIYGISGFGLSENLDIPVGEAKRFIDHYLESYPGIKTYMDECIKKAYLDGYVKTLFNRKRIIPELANKNYMIRSQGERMALNTPIQGTSADIIKKAMIEIHNRFRKQNIKSKMILQVHDELIFECLESELEIIKSIVKEVMEGVVNISVPLRVDINYGKNWYDAK